MSIFSQTALRIFEALNILQARGFQVLRPNGRTVPWAVNNFGRMAVGHAVASYPVHVVTAAGSSLGVVVTDNTLFWLAIGKGAGNGVAAVQATGTALALMVNTLEVARVNNSGVLGIGTTTPLTPLNVAGVSPSVRITDTRNITWSGNEILGAYEFYSNDASAPGARLIGSMKVIQDNGVIVSPAGALGFYTAASGGTETEKVRISNAGNVGIGTTTPTNLLDVNAGRIRVRTAVTPASSTAAANQGEIFWDGTYGYIAVGTNSIKRFSLATF